MASLKEDGRPAPMRARSPVQSNRSAAKHAWDVGVSLCGWILHCCRSLSRPISTGTISPMEGGARLASHVSEEAITPPAYFRFRLLKVDCLQLQVAVIGISLSLAPCSLELVWLISHAVD